MLLSAFRGTKERPVKVRQHQAGLTRTWSEPMPKAASSVHNSVTSSIRFDLPEGASEDDRRLAERIISRCVESMPPSDDRATPVCGMCWEWTGAKNADGYGTIWSFRKSVGTHREIKRIAGFIVDGLAIDHLCRNVSCCNPSHLECVTVSENTRRGATCKYLLTGMCPRCSSTELVDYRGKLHCGPCRRASGRAYAANRRKDKEYAMEMAARGRAKRAFGNTLRWREFLRGEP